MLRQEGRPSSKPPWGTNTRGHPQPSHKVPSLSTKFEFRQQQNAAVRAFNIGCCKGLPYGKTMAASAVYILQDLWLRLKRLPLEPPDVDLLLAWAGRCSELIILERNGMYGVLEYDLWWFFAQSFQRIDGFSGRQPRPPYPLPTDPTEGSRRQRAERRTIEQSRALESASPKARFSASLRSAPKPIVFADSVAVRGVTGEVDVLGSGRALSNASSNHDDDCSVPHLVEPSRSQDSTSPKARFSASLRSAPKPIVFADSVAVRGVTGEADVLGSGRAPNGASDALGACRKRRCRRRRKRVRRLRCPVVEPVSGVCLDLLMLSL